MPRGRISPRAMANHETDSPMPSFTKAKFSSHPNVLFNENLSVADMDRIERSINTATTQDPFYNAMSPPGLTPTKFSQRAYNDSTPKSDFLGISPMGRDAMSPSYQFGGNSPNKKLLSPYAQNFSDPTFGGISPFAPQQQGFQLQPNQFNNMYMKRMNVGGSVAMQGQDEYGGYDQEQNFDGEFEQGGPREKKKPIILDESKERFCGRLKFFDENKKYGFIVMDDDNSDIFVHFDDLCRANVSKEMLRTVRTGNVLRFNFGLMDYIGKYNRSRKAIDIQMEAN
jgi:cold shock CspA family protein